MNFEEIMNAIDEHLQEVNSDQKERLERIQKLQDFLSYNRRLTELSDAEKESFVRVMEGVYTQAERDKVEGCATEKEKSHYIEMYARSMYFKRCAWMAYLHGEDSSKPFVGEIEKK